MSISKWAFSTNACHFRKIGILVSQSCYPICEVMCKTWVRQRLPCASHWCCVISNKSVLDFNVFTRLLTSCVLIFFLEKRTMVRLASSSTNWISKMWPWTLTCSIAHRSAGRASARVGPLYHKTSHWSNELGLRNCEWMHWCITSETG